MIENLPLPTTLATNLGAVTLRPARLEDLVDLMALLADDAVAPTRGDRAHESDIDLYRVALAEVIADASNEVIVAVGQESELIATFQLTRIPSMSRRGATRLQIEAVRVARTFRSAGIGATLMRWVLEDAAPAVGASLVQLTSDAQRDDAHRFYERLGFVASHRGYKVDIPAR